jgi:hypothetical protein
VGISVLFGTSQHTIEFIAASCSLSCVSRAVVMFESCESCWSSFCVGCKLAYGAVLAGCSIPDNGQEPTKSSPLFDCCTFCMTAVSTSRGSVGLFGCELLARPRRVAIERGLGLLSFRNTLRSMLALLVDRVDATRSAHQCGPGWMPPTKAPSLLCNTSVGS